jgi:AAA family ATP:ADP antiporter
MFGPFKSIRAKERRDVLVAFGVLFGLVGSHAVLETARDALFLASIPAERLPLVTLGIAALSLVLAQLQGKVTAKLSRKVAVGLGMLVAAAITGAFAFWVPRSGDLGLYALYAWAGVVTTLVLVQFWSLLGDLFSVTQAKRLYGAIGSGSVAGAIAGSALAAGLARRMHPQDLLEVAALGFLVTGLLVPFLRDPGTLAAEDAAPDPAEAPPRQSLPQLFRNPYTMRVAGLVVLSAAALNLADYLFKAAAADAYGDSPEALGAFFATTYLVLNVLSLVSQLGLVTYLLRRVDLTTALGVLPALLLVGAGGFLLGGSVFGTALVGGLLLKGVDGAFKHSLHRTTVELLYVPLTEDTRARIKAIIDVAGQRGGAALGSVAVLLFAAVGLPTAAVAGVLVVLTVLWLAGAMDFRRVYLDLFRRRLKGGVSDGGAAFGELDVANLQSLLAALDSEVDDEVCAALQVFARKGWSHLVPRLILYHPNPRVLEVALAVFRGDPRPAVHRAAEGLLDHADARVRLAAVGTLAESEGGLARLESRFPEESAEEVRVALLAFLVARRRVDREDLVEAIDGALKRDDVEVLTALAAAIGASGLALPGLLERLAASGHPEVEAEAIRSMGELREPACLPTVIRGLGRESVDAAARQALRRLGPAAWSALEAAFDDRTLLPHVRWRLPTAVGDALPPEQAGALLVERLDALEAGMMRRRAVETLRRLRREDPELRLDARHLDRAIEDAISRAYRYLDRRLCLVGAREEVHTPGHRLILQALEDRETFVQDVLFGLLALRYPEESFDEIRVGLESPEVAQRASAVELLEALLPARLRAPVIGLFDDGGDAERLASAGPFHQPARRTYAESLAVMLDSPSHVFQSLAAYHVGELGWVERFREPLEHLAAAGVEDAERALAAVRGAA